MDNLVKIPYLIVRFENELAPYEVPAFRGAILAQVPKELVLFHNHTEDGFRYHYPLIQYKRIKGRAAIVCVGEGTNEIEHFFLNEQLDMEISGRKEPFKIQQIVARNWLLQVWDADFTYSMIKWLALSEDNYQKYHELEGLVEKTNFLEHILIGNILSLCKGLDVHLDKQLTCKIISIRNERLYKFKNVRMQGMDIVFKTNISLTDYVGLGKGVSIGHGIIKRIYEHQLDKI